MSKGMTDPFGYGAAQLGAAVAGLAGSYLSARKTSAVGVHRTPATVARGAPVNRVAMAAPQEGKLKRIVKKAGRPIAKRQRLLKLVNATLQPVVERYQYLQAFNAGSGVCSFDYQPTATSGIQYYPVYAFDLLSVVNRYSERGDKLAAGNPITSYPSVLYRLCRNYSTTTTTDAANNFFWTPTDSCRGMMPDGTTRTYSWAVEKAPRSMVMPMASCHFDWFDFRFMFYGAKNQNIKINIDLVQFLDDKFIEGYRYDSADGNSYGIPSKVDDAWYSGSEDRAREWNEFWTGYCDRLITSPLNKRDAYNLKGIKYLARDSITFAPRQTDVDDTRGDRRMYQLFKRINRMARYQYMRTEDFSKFTTGTNYFQGGIGIPPNKEADPNVWDTRCPLYQLGYTEATTSAFTDCQCIPKPKARMYLLLSAECPVSGAGTTADNASFDFCIRRKRTIVGST